MRINEFTSRADMDTAVMQYERARDAIEAPEDPDPVDIESVLAGHMDKDNAGHDFLDMWRSEAMAMFFDAVQCDYDASADLLAMIGKHADESEALKRRLDALISDLVGEL
jgi:hypothetical protein